jgi:hypothetical protein
VTLYICSDSFIGVKNTGKNYSLVLKTLVKAFYKTVGRKTTSNKKISKTISFSISSFFVNYFNALQLSFQAESPTNHATVLSILALKQQQQQQRGLGGEEGAIPPACCVPRKMDSLTVLYFDNDGSVVLKTYPQMSVQSCGCR